MVTYTTTRLNRDALEITDERLEELLERVTPLILKNGVLWTFEAVDPRSDAFTQEPKLIDYFDGDRHEVMVTRTQHSSGYHAFFKPSLAEVLAQMPDDDRITAFYLEANEITVLGQGDGHEVTCHWLESYHRHHRHDRHVLGD